MLTYHEIASDPKHKQCKAVRNFIDDKLAFYEQWAMIVDIYLRGQNVPHRPTLNFYSPPSIVDSPDEEVLAIVTDLSKRAASPDGSRKCSSRPGSGDRAGAASAAPGKAAPSTGPSPG